MRPLIFKLLVDAKGAIQGFKSVDGAMVNTAKQAQVQGRRFKQVIDTAFGVSVASLVANLAGQLTRLATGAIELINESVQKAGMQQIAERKLEQALRNLGEASPEVAAKLKEVAAQVQQLSNFGDEEIITAQAMLLSFQEVAGPKGAELLTSRLADTAAGVAKVTGETSDLNQVAALMGRALTTGAGALTRVGVSLTDAQKAAFDAAEGIDRVNILAEILDSNFKGLAAATVDPFRQLENAVGDLQEAFASEFLPVLQDVARELTELTGDEGVRELVRQIGENLAQALERVSGLLKDNKDDIVEIASAVVDAITNIFDLAGAIDQLARAISGVVGSDSGALDMFLDALKGGTVLANLLIGAVEKLAHAIRVLTFQEYEDSIARAQARLQADLAPATPEGTADGPLPPTPPPPPIDPEKALKLEEELQRLRIELMQEGFKKEVALVDQQFEERKRKARELYGAQADELVDLLGKLQEKQREAVARLFARPDFEVEIPLRLDLDNAEHELQAFLHDMEPLVIGSIQEVERRLAGMEDAFAKATTDAARKTIREDIKLLEQLLDELVTGIPASLQALQDTIGGYADTMISAAQGLADLQSALHDRRVAELDEEHRLQMRNRDAEIDALEAQMNQEGLSAEQRGRYEELRLQAINRREQQEELYEQRRRELARQQAQREKLLAIFTATIQGAVAVVEALPNLFKAAAMSVLTGVQIAAIAATPVPAFAKGVTNFSGGAALVGEQGPELVTLPSGSNVITNENTQALLGAIGTLGQRGRAGGGPHMMHLPSPKEYADAVVEALRGVDLYVDVTDINRAQAKRIRVKQRKGVG